jgi:hypothetical protein
MRFPPAFDEKLRQAARALGVNLNSAVLQAVTGLWELVIGRGRLS